MTFPTASLRRFVPACGAAAVVLACVGCPPPADDGDVDVSLDPIAVDDGTMMDNTTMGGAMGDNATVVTEVPAE